MKWGSKKMGRRRQWLIALLALFLFLIVLAQLTPRAGAQAIPGQNDRFELHAGSLPNGTWFVDIVSTSFGDADNIVSVTWTGCTSPQAASLQNTTQGSCAVIPNEGPSLTTQWFRPRVNAYGGDYVQAQIALEDGTLFTTKEVRLPDSSITCTRTVNPVTCTARGEVPGSEKEVRVIWQYEAEMGGVAFHHHQPGESFVHPDRLCGRTLPIYAIGTKANGEVAWQTGVFVTLDQFCTLQNLPLVQQEVWDISTPPVP